MNIVDLKDEIIKYGKLLYAKNLSPATSGNMSVRFGENFLITTSGTCLGDLNYDDIVLINYSGELLEGSKNASSEKFLHLKTYELRPDVNAIIHSHSPKATAFATAGLGLELPINAEIVFYFEKIKLAKYATPSSEQLIVNTVPFLRESDAVLMENHGLLTCSSSVKEAFFNVERVESYASTYIDAKILGRLHLLSRKGIENVRNLRK